MNKFISRAIFNLFSKITSFLQDFRAVPLTIFVLASLLLIPSNAGAATNTQPSGEELLQRVRQHDQDSARPKTNGEFLEEARGDVPLNKRVYNITRDSKEAFKDVGENISQSAKENIRRIKDNAAQTTENPS